MKKKSFKYYTLIFFIIGVLIILPKSVSAEIKYTCVYKFDNIPCGSCMAWDGWLTSYPPKCLTDQKCPMTVSFSIDENGHANGIGRRWDDENQSRGTNTSKKDPDKKCEEDGSCFSNYIFESCPPTFDMAISGYLSLTLHPLAPSFSASSYYTSEQFFTGTLNAEESDLGSNGCEFSDSEIENSINNIRSKQEEEKALLADLENTITNNDLTNEILEEQNKKIESVDREIKDIYANAQSNYSSCQKWIDYMGSGEYDRIKGELYNTTSNLNSSIQELDNISTKNKNDFGTIINAMNKEYNSGITEGDLSGCGVLSQNMISIIQDATKLIQIGVPILLIVLGTVDFAKAVMVNDQDSVKKAGASFAKRCVAGIIVFFLPLLITLIFQMDGIRDLPGIKDMVDPLCRQQGGVK